VTDREPAAHFLEPDLKYLRIRLLEGVVPIMDFDGLCDPYVKVDTGLMQWDSNVIKGTLTPGWYQEAVVACYDLRHAEDWNLTLPDELRSDCVRLIMLDWNVTKDRRIGFITLRLRDIPGYDTDDIVEPPAPHWYEGERHMPALSLTRLVNSDFGRWLSSLYFDEKIKARLKEQRRKMAVISMLQSSGVAQVGHLIGDRLAEINAKVQQRMAELRKGSGPELQFKTTEELQVEAMLPPDDAGEEELLKQDRSLLSIKAQIWFDNTYVPPPPKIIGQLYVQLHSVELKPRDNGAPRSPMVVLRYQRHWVRLPTVLGNHHAAYLQEYYFGVVEPSDVFTIAVFDDGDGFSSDPKVMGLQRVQPCTLASNKKYRTTLPLYQRFKGAVHERGKITFTICLYLPSVAPMLVAMFKPPLKELYYYAPLGEFTSALTGNKPLDFETPIRVNQFERLLEIVKQQGKPEWRPQAIKATANSPSPKLDLDLLTANWSRLQQCFKVLFNFVDYLDYICQWTDVRASVTVNAGSVLLVCYIEWLPEVLVLYLLYAFTKGFMRRTAGQIVVPLDAGLFGGVVNTEDNMDDDDDAEGEGKKKDAEDAETSAWEDIQKILQMAVKVQELLGDVASFAERVEALPKWKDPRISGLLCVIFAVLLPGLCYLPLKAVVSFVFLFVLRHPALRDPIPPPPVNMIMRLPTRAPLLVPKTSRLDL